MQTSTASGLPEKIKTREEPPHKEFEPRIARSLFKAFRGVQAGAGPRAQMDSLLSLRFFRCELVLQLNPREAASSRLAFI
jgi:hypothetical protein